MLTIGEKFSLVHGLPKPEKDIFVYALCEPNSLDIRYIGLATSGFKRIKRHYDGGGEWSSVKRWIKDHKNNGKIFNIIYLEYFDKDSHLVDEEEIFYISYMRSLGFNLLNATDGGRREYLQLSQKQKEERKKAHQSTEAKEKLRQISLNMWKQPGFKDEMKKLHQEYRGEEYSNKIAKTLSDKVGLKIKDDLGNIYNSGQECATALGVKKPCVYRAIRKGYKCKGRTLTYLGGGRNEKLTSAWPEAYKHKNQKTITTVPVQDSNGIVYDTFKDAAEKLGVSSSHINKILKTGEVSSILGLSFKRLPKVKTVIKDVQFSQSTNRRSI